MTTKLFNFLIIHSFKTFECDLCKKKIPEKVKINEKIIQLIDYQKPENNYISLESINKDPNDTRYIYIIHMKDKSSIRLGRANDSDVRMVDISVSRCHAILRLINGSFYIEDSSSKFGSLVQIKNNFTVFPNKAVSLQVGRNFLIMNLSRTFLSFLRCYQYIHV